MRFTLSVALSLGLAAHAQPAAVPRFPLPDGHWWLAASADEHDGFVIGQDACESDLLHHRGPEIRRVVFANSITDYYQAHRQSIALPVTTVVGILERGWRATRAYRFVVPPAGLAYDSGIWWEGTPEDRDGIIRGFTACQDAEQGADIQVPVAELIQRVSDWYGIDPRQEGVVNPKTADDKLAGVIVQAEKRRP